MRRLSFVLTCMAVVAIASPTWARQADRGTAFFGAGAIAAIQKGPSTLAEGDGASSTVGGGQLQLGVHLTRRVSARFEWAMTAKDVTEQSYPAYPLTTTLDFGDLASGLLPSGGTQLSLLDQKVRQERKTMSGLALLGYHLGEGRVSLEVLGGLGFVHQELKMRYQIGILRDYGFNVPETTFSSSTYHGVGVAGVDVAVALTDHASIVPSVRAFSIDNALSLRPGVSVRWTF